MLAPVVIFVYNRPEHTKKTIEALANNYLADDSIVYIFSDGPKNYDSIEKVEQVRRYIDTLKNKNYFKMLIVEKSETNRGLANSIIYGVSKVINEYGKVIVLEDDLVTSKDFLRYMNDALNYYEKDTNIWSISGYTPPIKMPKGYNKDIYFVYRGCSWGWATWLDRWNKVDWQVSDYDLFKKDKKLQKKLNLGGRDMAMMLKLQMEGKIDSWAIRWCYAQSKLGMATVYPVFSRVRNIGLDGSGTHSGKNSLYEVVIKDEYEKCNFSNFEINNEISKLFRDFYMSRGTYIKVMLKEKVNEFIRMW